MQTKIKNCKNQDLSKTPIVGNNYSKEGLIIGLQHNSQVQGMAHYNLCCKHWKRNYGRVYIFKGEIIRNKYIKNYKLGTSMVMQKKRKDNILSIQGVFIILHKISSNWYLLIQLSFISFRKTWFVCSFGSNRTSIVVWVGHVHITFTHFSCFVTP